MTTVEKLAEFVTAQNQIYDQVRQELASGRKKSHWIWFIFPQMHGLGSSVMSQKFGIASIDEARAYLQHNVLGPRLRECTRLMLAVPHQDVAAVLDHPDDLKFHSSMTLFALAAQEELMFQTALDKFFNDERDGKTITLLGQATTWQTKPR